jgi:hypothetical protein
LNSTFPVGSSKIIVRQKIRSRSITPHAVCLSPQDMPSALGVSNFSKAEMGTQAKAFKAAEAIRCALWPIGDSEKS